MVQVWGTDIDKMSQSAYCPRVISRKFLYVPRISHRHHIHEPCGFIFFNNVWGKQMALPPYEYR